MTTTWLRDGSGPTPCFSLPLTLWSHDDESLLAATRLAVAAICGATVMMEGDKARILSSFRSSHRAPVNFQSNHQAFDVYNPLAPCA
jgi:hypothetical protein